MWSIGSLFVGLLECAPPIAVREGVSAVGLMVSVSHGTAVCDHACCCLRGHHMVRSDALTADPSGRC